MRGWFGTMVLAVSMGCQTGEPIPADSGTVTFEVCETIRETASRVPVNLLLTVDRSESMSDGQPISKWEAMTRALEAFVDTPDSQQLRVGLRLWPADDGCNSEECDVDACSAPQVAVGPLTDDAQRKRLLDEVAGQGPAGETPMSAALEGARAWASDVRQAVPKEQVAIALATDGMPNGCDESIENISGIAATALADDVPTYVLGIEGSRESDVDEIATAGGTEQAFLVGSDNAEAALLEALLLIGGDVLSCSYDFPMGEELDPARIRVLLEREDESVRIPRVDDEAACDEGGFYLTEDGSRITLCDVTCEEVRDVLEGEIDIAIGCVCETDDDCPDDETCQDNVCVPDEDDPDEDGPSGEPRVQGGATRCQTGSGLTPWGLPIGLLLVVARRRRGDA